MNCIVRYDIPEEMKFYVKNGVDLSGLCLDELQDPILFIEDDEQQSKSDYNQNDLLNETQCIKEENENL